MRKGLSVILFAALALPAYSGDADKARQIVERSIKAVGGAEVLKKHEAATYREKGTYYGMGDGLPYTANYAVQWPDKFRMEIEGIFTIGLDGNKGWMKMGDMVQDMTKEQVDQHVDAHRAGWIASLLPLKDKAFTLSLVGDSKVDDRPAVTVKVTRKDYPEVNLSFDAKTGLLAKAEFRTKAAEQGFQEVNQEVFYQNYKAHDGAQVPTKIIIKRDGKLYIDSEVLEMNAVGKLDAKTFARP